MTLFQLQWQIKEQHEGMLVREFLLKYKNISRRALTDIKFHGGAILVNDKHVTVRYPLKVGDCLTIKFPPEIRSEGIKPENIPLDIVYEDDSILVINKPPFMPSIPSREHPSKTLANALVAYFEKIELPSTIHIVNRLDRDTSGLMLVAKHSYIHYLFSLEQKKATIHRQYEAIVHGVMAEDMGMVSAPIGRKETSIIEREVREDGQHACTHFKVIKRSGDWTWVLLKLETGRTHQIRVHMSYLGHPLLGDTLYGGKQTRIGRQALHSKRLRFFHPLLQKELEFKAPLPEDIKRIVK